MNKEDIAKLILANTIQVDECLIYQGSKSRGYGMIWIKPAMLYTHRVMFEALIGKIPEKFDLDHLCRRTDCVNVKHLEAVTHRTNVLRGIAPAAKHAAKTECIHGHEFSKENTYYRKSGARCCRICMRARTSKYGKKRWRTLVGITEVVEVLPKKKKK